jgi:4-oxalocrotonate tautomerase
MPNIVVEIFPGRTLDQRREFVRAVTESCVDIFDVTPDRVRITFVEYERSDLAVGGELVCDKPVPLTPSQLRQQAEQAGQARQAEQA